MKKNSLIYFLIFFSIVEVYSQTYSDYFGTGHNIGVIVTTSDNNNNNNGENTLNGTGYVTDLIGASRFLGQATLGANHEAIEHVEQIGIDRWLDEQIEMPASSYEATYKSIYEEVIAKIEAVHGPFESDRRRDYLNFTFYQKVLKEEDALRHKMAFALSQLFVVSINGNLLFSRGYGTSNYYDVLYQGAFNNFRDILEEVTFHPIMGMYLSHFKNKKADLEAGTFPDENFAREIMQLFTIGLYEMNNDGSYKRDNNGALIPTYDIVDIQELAKVFTGLSGGEWDLELKPENEGTELTFYKGYNSYDLTVPMKMFEEHHDTGEKVMIDGSIIPAGQTGIEDINDALDVLFNHPNVGPFVSTRLIQQFVKSNPSPAYINRVATVFNNNGQGIRGDMEAVIRAILMDIEARECEWIDDPKSGKLIQPVERLTHLFKAFDIDSPSGNLWFRDFQLIFDKVEQSFLAAPSVFNFYSPFYAEDVYVNPNEMVSPEFQILHSVSAMNYINLIEDMIKVRPFKNRTGVNEDKTSLNNNLDDNPFLDLTDELNIYNSQGLETLIDRLDLILCHGQLSDGTKSIIINTVNQYIENENNYTDQEIINDILYFMMMSPDYVILK